MKSVKEIAKDSVKQYFAPLKVIVAFLAIFGEMFSQFFLSMKTDSEKFQEMQDDKLEQERYEGLVLDKGEVN